jgi:hypothetical protein
VQDDADRTFTFVYFGDEPNRRNFTRALSKRDARKTL